MFFEYAKTFFQFVYAFCTSDYGKIKTDDQEKISVESDSYFIIIRDSFEKTLLDD